MIPEQRHQELLRLLRASGVLSIRTISALMNISHMTVRRDIAALEEGGHVVSVKGGVRLADWTSAEPPRERSSRAVLEIPRKRGIAELAATFVRDDMVLFLDAGTTCEAVVPHLTRRQGLTVVTNDFHTAATLLGHPEIATIHTGGEVDVSSGSSTGRLAARTVSELSIDLFFMSTGTWDLEHGVTTPETAKVELKQAVMDAATSTYLVADSTKFGTYERFRVSPVDRLDAVVTDDGLPAAAVAALDELGIAVHQARSDF